MLHNLVVAVSVYADVRVMCEAEIHALFVILFALANGRFSQFILSSKSF